MKSRDLALLLSHHCGLSASEIEDSTFHVIQPSGSLVEMTFDEAYEHAALNDELADFVQAVIDDVSPSFMA